MLTRNLLRSILLKVRLGAVLGLLAALTIEMIGVTMNWWDRLGLAAFVAGAFITEFVGTSPVR